MCGNPLLWTTCSVFLVLLSTLCHLSSSSCCHLALTLYLHKLHLNHRRSTDSLCVSTEFYSKERSFIIENRPVFWLWVESQLSWSEVWCWRFPCCVTKQLLSVRIRVNTQWVSVESLEEDNLLIHLAQTLCALLPSGAARILQLHEKGCQKYLLLLLFFKLSGCVCFASKQCDAVLCCKREKKEKKCKYAMCKLYFFAHHTAYTSNKLNKNTWSWQWPQIITK